MEDERVNEPEAGRLQDEEAEMLERFQQEIRNLPVADHLLYMMHSLSTLAVGRMGLSGDEHVKADLEQARLAIDAFKALLDLVEQARPGEVTAHRGTLSQLQLAFVAELDAGRQDAEPEAG